MNEQDVISYEDGRWPDKNLPFSFPEFNRDKFNKKDLSFIKNYGVHNIEQMLSRGMAYNFLFKILSINHSQILDLGSGFGQEINKTVYGGEVGILFDGRINNIKGQSISQDKNKIKEYYNKTKVYSL